jgi:hypothetical protein
MSGKYLFLLDSSSSNTWYGNKKVGYSDGVDVASAMFVCWRDITTLTHMDRISMEQIEYPFAKVRTYILYCIPCASMPAPAMHMQHFVSGLHPIIIRSDHSQAAPARCEESRADTRTRTRTPALLVCATVCTSSDRVTYMSSTNATQKKAYFVSSLEEFLRGFATFGMIVHVIEYIVHNT